MEVALVIAVIVVIFIVRTFKIVPQQHAWVVERLGKYDRTLTPGLKFVIPFVERVAYRHSLKEVPLDVPSQVCITKDNTQLHVDGILYFQVTDPRLASYRSTRKERSRPRSTMRRDKPRLSSPSRRRTRRRYGRWRRRLPHPGDWARSTSGSPRNTSGNSAIWPRARTL
jgi:regulator of protease activity HflC (stomatin/prohibitin superfamily)